jgi:DNA-binding transcriptional MerR regulator
MKIFIFVFPSAVCFAAEVTLNSDISVKVKSKGPHVRIGELSRTTGASARSLRYYEKLGLISSERESNGYREYDASAIHIVGTIKSLLELGFPTTLIEQVLPCTGDSGPVEMSCSSVMEKVARIRDEMDEKSRRLAETRDVLTAFLEQAAA